MRAPEIANSPARFGPTISLAAKQAAILLDAPFCAHKRDELFVMPLGLVDRAHARADGGVDRRETEHVRERGVAGEERAVGARDVDPERRTFEQFAVPLLELGTGKGRRHNGRRVMAGGASSVR